MAEVSLDSVIGKITNATMPIGDLAKALEDVKLESKAGEEANRQLRDLIEKQSSMSAKERRASQKQLDDITKLIQNSSEIADSDKIKFQTLIKMHDQRIKSDSSLMKDVGSQLTEKITENVTNIGAVVSGVVSDSPLLAMGVKFLGDSVVKGVRSFRAFQKKNKEEKELRSRQTELFREQERIDEEERRILREQLTEKDIQNKLNITEEDIQKKAEETNRSRESIVNEEKDKIIEQSKIAKQRKDNAAAEQKRIEELKDSVGLVTAIEEEIEQEESPEESEISGEPADVVPSSSTSTESEKTIVVDRIESPVKVSSGDVQRVSVVEGEVSESTPEESEDQEERTSDDPVITAVESESIVGDGESRNVTVETTEPTTTSSEDLKEFMEGNQSQQEIDSIEAERQRKRDLEKTLNVENNQSGLLEESLDKQDETIESQKGLNKSFAPISGFFKGLLKVFAALRLLPPLIAAGLASVKAFLGSIISAPIVAIGAGIVAIGTLMSDLPLRIAGFINEVVPKIGEFIDSAIQTASDFFADIFQKIKDFFSDLIPDWLKNNPVTDAAGAAADSASEFVSEKMDAAGEFASEVGNNIANSGVGKFVGSFFGGDEEAPESRISPAAEETLTEQANVTAIREGISDNEPIIQTAVATDPSVVAAANENVTAIPTDLAQQSRNPSQDVSVVEGTSDTTSLQVPTQISGIPNQELGNVSSPMSGLRNAAAMTMKENAIDRTSASNVSSVLNNLVNTTNNNVTNTNTTVVPPKAYNTENSFSKINSALSGAL